jgi:HD-like signal output (HDOD) protein/nitrogen-specific signal transduction histidine kinase
MQEVALPDLGSRLLAAKLPALPQVLLQLLELSERDDVELGRIATVVNADSGIAAKVINVANSAYFNRGHSVTNIHQCLAVLGTSQVRRIALNLSVSSLFGSFSKPSGFDLGYYWFHVLSVALCARRLAQRIDYPFVDEAYLAGLLHDIGQLALLSVVPEQYLPIMAKHAIDEDALHRQERADLGVTHAMAGALLAQKWNLNPFFVDGLLYHHEPIERILDAHALVRILALANQLRPQADGHPPDERLLAMFNLDADGSQSLLESVLAEAKLLADELGIEIRTEPRDPVVADPAAQSRLADAVGQRLEGQSALPDEAGHKSRASGELQRGLLRSAKMLFETTTAALFSPEDDKLIGLSANEEDNRIAEIHIPMNAANSAIARAWRGEICLAGLAPQEESLADAQVMHVFDSQRLLCLPLSMGLQCLAVLVVGLKANSADELLKRQILLRSFSREAGRRLAARMGPEDGDSVDMQQIRKTLHEVSNPLSVVRNYIVMLREQLVERKQAQQDCDLIESELRRVARILEQLRMPSQTTPEHLPRPAGIDVNALVADVARLAQLGRPEFKNIRIQLKLDETLPPLASNADKLKQILVNLVFNAAEAMPDGGEILLMTARRAAAKGSENLEITVQDNGPGLPAHVLDSLYLPVNSSKGGQHQGLGLSIMAKLVDELGGSKQCSSSAAGTRFRILLPI